MTRSTQTLARVAAAAFDFDVVTDAPPRRPAATPEAKGSQPDPKSSSPATVSEAGR